MRPTTTTPTRRGAAMMRQIVTAQLLKQGFSLDAHGRAYCDACDACTISGIACHETGCPNLRHECKGCNATVARRGQYCEDCQ